MNLKNIIKLYHEIGKVAERTVQKMKNIIQYLMYFDFEGDYNE